MAADGHGTCLALALARLSAGVHLPDGCADFAMATRNPLMNHSLLRSVLFLSLGSLAGAQTLTANFDSFTEGVAGTTLTDGAITVLNLDNAFPGGSNPPFTIDQADATLSGQAGFTANNVLGFSGLVPGAQAGFTRCKSFDVQWTGGNAASAQLEVYDFGGYAGNSITLQAIAGGVVVGSSSFTITAPFVVGHHTLAVSGVSFDTLRLIGGGPQDSGVFFAVVDSIRVDVLTATPGVPECFGDDVLASCPCSNESVVGDNVGCLNSLGVGGRLRSAGTASLSNDNVVLDGSQVPNGPALYFQGSDHVLGGAGVAFGDGLRCAGGTLVRLGIKTSVGGASQFPGPADAALHAVGLVSTPGVRYYQLWYRDAASFCTASTFNLTNGLRMDWVP